MIAAFYADGARRMPSVPDGLAIAVATVAAIVLLAHSLEVSRKSVVSTIAGVVYIPFMGAFPIELFHAMGAGGTTYVFTLVWMILVAKCCDIGGMFVGKIFGRRRLAPNFSPNKTVEGLIGGVLLSNLVGLLGGAAFFANRLPRLNCPRIVMLSTLLAAFSLVGDLTESSIKRLADEKDSGTMFPGIGGMFDLTDSLLFSVPLGVIFLKLFILR
jgi:phosphatidate cytidylyltransferase